MSRKRVVRLMQAEGLHARPRKRFKVTTMSDHGQPVAANLLNREFRADAPNQRSVGDTSEFVIGEHCKLYLATILDLFSRFVVGWAVSAVNDRHLAIKVLEMAPVSRVRAASSFRPRLHVRERGLPARARDVRDRPQHESTARLLRQCGAGEFLLHREDGAERSLREPRRREDVGPRLHRGVL